MGTNFYWLDDREGSVVEGVHVSAPATGPSRGPSRSGARAPVGSDSVAPTAPQGGPDTAALSTLPDGAVFRWCGLRFRRDHVDTLHDGKPAVAVTYLDPVVSDPKRCPAGTRGLMGPDDQVEPLAFKACACGQAYSAAQWSCLPYRGEQRVPEDDDAPAATLELRLCVMCGSTIAVELRAGTER